jgi:circadian clock protein KaiC
MAACVVVLQHSIDSGAAVRTFRISKYRGITHSANEFPFTISANGIDVAGGTSVQIDHPVSKERITSGVERLDVMLHGGYFRGSSVLISGAPGTSKTTLVAAFAEAACRRGEATIYVSFDEAPAQIIRNVGSVGIKLSSYVASGVLTMCSLRARSDNPQAHVARIRMLIERNKAKHIVIDPISALSRVSDQSHADRAAVQVLDLAKSRGLTTLATSLLANAAPLSEETPIGISTIADTWMHVSYVSDGGERNRALTIIKSRGMSHSNQVREMIVTDKGISLADPYMAGGAVLMGTLRWERENSDRRKKEQALTELQMSEKHAELALAETRLRIEAARTEESVRLADLSRIVASRAVKREEARVEKVELSSRRGGNAVAEPAARGSKNRRRRAS